MGSQNAESSPGDTQEPGEGRGSIPHQRSTVREAVLAALDVGKGAGTCRNLAGREDGRCTGKDLPASSHCHGDLGDPSLKNTAGPDRAAASRLRSTTPLLKFLLLYQAYLPQCLG